MEYLVNKKISGLMILVLIEECQIFIHTDNKVRYFSKISLALLLWVLMITLIFIISNKINLKMDHT